tara:strand:+ start:11629 stop:12978 length:1350 start_codon:yes stop_codon:yes gene_type:complete
LKNQIVTFLFFWLGQISFFIFNFISSKELSTSEYGVYSIVLAVIMFGMRFMEVGIGDYYVIKGSEDKLKTIFTINLIKGFVIMGVFLCSSFFLDDFYNSNVLFPLIFASSFIFILEPLKNPMLYKFYKEKRMIPVVITERASYLLSSIIGIVLMLYFKSIWVLIFMYIFYFSSQILLSYILLPNFPISKFNRSYAKEILTFSKHIIGFILLTYFIRQGLDLIIPKLIGIPNFAVYSFTFLIGVSPTNFLIYPFNKLIYPIYTSEVINNSLGMIVNKVLVKVLYLMIFLSLTIYYFSPLILKLLDHTKLFDYKLLGAVLLYGLFRGIAATLGTIYKALNLQKRYNKVLIIEALIIFGLLVVFNQSAIIIMMVLGIAMVVHLTVGLIVLRRSVELDLKKLILNMMIGLILIFIELFLSNYFIIPLVILNALIFMVLLIKFFTSLKHYFIKS